MKQEKGNIHITNRSQGEFFDSPSIQMSKPPIHANPQTIVLLVPDSALIPGALPFLNLNSSRYETLLTDMQRLRGRIYLRDGAIRPEQLTIDGRHQVDGDESSWSLLLIKTDDQVVGCTRYLQHENTVEFRQLNVSKSALAQSEDWGGIFRDAVENELLRARQRKVTFVELGGWAIADELRGTTQALRIAMATYGLGRLLGGSVGITTATSRNRSATMLRRFGGYSLAARGRELPAYFDPSYQCEMEILAFDSEAPNPKFKGAIEAVQSEMVNIPVVSRNPAHLAARFTDNLVRLSANLTPGIGITESSLEVPAQIMQNKTLLL